MLAPQRHTRFVAVAHEQEGFDHARQRVAVRPRMVVGHHLDVLGANGDVRVRARRQEHARRPPAGERGAGERSVQLHGDGGRRLAGRELGDAARQDHGLAQEVPHEARGRVLVQAAGRADLLDAPALHYRDAVGQAERLDLVVGHEEHRDAEPALEQLQLDPHLLAELGIEVAERLVQQQEIRLVHERPAESQALHLAAAQQRGRARLESLESDQAQHPLDLVADDAALHAAERERIGDVLEDGHVRPDRVRLEDHAEVPEVRREEHPPRHRGHHAAAQRDLARVGALEPGDQAQRGRLAAAARSEQGEDFAPPDFERCAVHRGVRAEGFADVVER